MQRIAIVGAGLMGRWHAHAAHHAGARVMAVVDSDLARAHALAARHRSAQAFDALPAALDQVDVVHVCSPGATHPAIATMALSAAKHVLVEKPVAPSAAHTERLLELARANGVLLCPVHQFLFQDGVRAAIAGLAGIGPLRHVDVTICSAGADGAGAALRQSIAEEILIHPVSLVTRLVPGYAADTSWLVRSPMPGEIRVLGQSGDVSLSITVSMSGRPPVNRMQLVGERGTTHVDLFHGFAVTERAPVSRFRKAARPLAAAAAMGGTATANLVRRALRREPAYPGLRALVALFYRAAAGTGPHPIPDDETRAVVRTVDLLVRECTRSCATL